MPRQQIRRDRVCFAPRWAVTRSTTAGLSVTVFALPASLHLLPRTSTPPGLPFELLLLLLMRLMLLLYM
jgi:hypothetical protein